MTQITKKYIMEWFEAAFIRACKSAGQVAVLMLGTEAFSAWDVDWVRIVGFMLGMFILSMLTSVMGIPEVEDGKDVISLYSKGEGQHVRKDE